LAALNGSSRGAHGLGLDQTNLERPRLRLYGNPTARTTNDGEIGAPLELGIVPNLIHRR
jgi:hypothetical protein